MNQGKKTISITLIFASVSIAVYEFVLYLYGIFPSENVYKLWSSIFLILIVMWIDLDSKEQKIYRPFEFGFLILIFWAPYLPYYFLKTRKLKGLVFLLGLLFLFNLGYLMQWLYYYSS